MNSSISSVLTCVLNRSHCIRTTIRQKLLEYYMGKNTMERQNFIIDNLVIEEDLPQDTEPIE